ncbi:MAG: hypothetical protein FDZ75_00640, partial [Actinobacteria bacterium]
MNDRWRDSAVRPSSSQPAGNAQQWRTLRRWTVVLTMAAVAASVFVGAVQAPSFVRKSIVLDGQFQDWDPVIRDPENIVYDATGGMDLDTSAAGDRNISRVIYTYDDTNVYFLVRAADTLRNSNYFIGYIDVNGNNAFDYPADRVMVHYLNPSGAWTKESHVYKYGTSGAYDPITGDGVQALSGFSEEIDSNPSTAKNDTFVIGSATVGNDPAYGLTGITGNKWVGATPIYMESRITWAMLGVAPGTPLNFHFSMANNVQPNSVPGNGIQDNTGPGTTAWTKLDLYPDRQTAGRPGTTVTLTHTIAQTANMTDTVDFSAYTVNGWPVTVKNSADATITSLTLRGNETTTVSLVVAIPPTATPGIAEDAYLTVKSRFRATVTDTVHDEIYPGALVIYPDRASTCATGTWVDYTHYVSNLSTRTLTVDLQGYSYAGWTTTITAGASGAGATTSTVVVAPSSVATVTLRVWVPPGATLGQQDVAELRGTAREDALYTDVAQDVTTVRSRIDIEPDNSVSVGKGQVIYFTHTVTNNWSSADTVTVTWASTVSTWTTTLYRGDEATPYAAPRFYLGARESTTVVVAVEIPPTAGSQTATVTLTATSTANPVSRDTATDTIKVVGMATYEDAMFTRPQTVFRVGSTVFVQETGEQTGYTISVGNSPATNVPVVRFKLVSPSGWTTTTVGAIIEGMADASLVSTTGTEVGVWTAYAYRDAAMTSLIASAPFTITYDADITSLGAADAQDASQTIPVRSTLANRNDVAINASTASYLVWYDRDSNGVFSANDYWVDSAWNVTPWDGVSPTVTHTSTVSVAATSSASDSWSLSNRNFPAGGMWNVTETWREARGFAIDTEQSR